MLENKLPPKTLSLPSKDRVFLQPLGKIIDSSTSQEKMSVDNSHSKEPVRTYKDDIVYQTVKGNQRRTSFVSSDHQIVNKGANAIRDIEKSEKLVTSDLRRSQTALLTRLEQLQRKQESILTGNGPETPHSRLNQRRSSAPFVSFHRLPSPTRKLRRDSSTLSPRRKRGSSGSSGCDDEIDACDNFRESSNFHSPRRERSIIRNASGSSLSGTTSPDMKEARRMSFAAQEETSRKALEKIDILVAEHKRRATIATGASHALGYLPNASDIARLTEIAKRSMSIEEEEDNSSVDN